MRLALAELGFACSRELTSWVSLLYKACALHCCWLVSPTLRMPALDRLTARTIDTRVDLLLTCIVCKCYQMERRARWHMGREALQTPAAAGATTATMNCTSAPHLHHLAFTVCVGRRLQLPKPAASQQQRFLCKQQQQQRRARRSVAHSNAGVTCDRAGALPGQRTCSAVSSATAGSRGAGQRRTPRRSLATTDFAGLVTPPGPRGWSCAQQQQ